jgi:hypothetical protein
MNFQELLMILCILAVVGILLYKIYNLMFICGAYEEPIAWITFAALFIIRLLALIVFLNELDMLYLGVYKALVWMSYFGIMLSCVELIIYRVIKLPVAKGRYSRDN